MPKSTSAVFGQAELDSWNRNGYVVLPNAVPSSQLNDTVIAMERFFGQDFSQPADWYKHPLFPGGIAPMGHDQELWNNRQSPRVYQAFAQLFDRPELRVSQDRVNFNPPNKNSVWNHQGTMHWDIDSRQSPIPFQVQGVLCLTDTDTNQGGFRCIPGFHRNLSDWAADQPADRPARMLDTSGMKVQSVPGRAGDLIIWHSALPHSNSANTSNRPRLAQYITMWPVEGSPSGSGVLPLAVTKRRLLAQVLDVAESLIAKWLLDYQESDRVLVEVDRLWGEHPDYLAWHVEVAGQSCYLRKPWVRPIDDRRLAIYRPYAMGQHIDTPALPIVDENAFIIELKEAAVKIPTAGSRSKLTENQLDQLKQFLSQSPNQYGFEQRLWDEDSISQMLKNKFDLEMETRLATLTDLGRNLAGVDAWSNP